MTSELILKDKNIVCKVESEIEKLRLLSVEAKAQLAVELKREYEYDKVRILVLKNSIDEYDIMLSKAEKENEYLKQKLGNKLNPDELKKYVDSHDFSAASDRQRRVLSQQLELLSKSIKM